MFNSIRTLIKGSKSVLVNGISVNGDISITDKGVYLNGKLMDESDTLLSAPKIVIHVTGDVEVVDTNQGEVTVKGNTGSVKTGQGNISIEGSVTGNIKTGQGDVTVDGNVSGTVKTGMGDIIVKGQVYDS